MYTIDLLHGCGRPIPYGRHFLVLAVLASCGLVYSVGWLGTVVWGLESQIPDQQRILDDQEQHLADLGEVRDYLKNAQHTKTTFQSRLSEIQQVFKHQKPWSGLIMAVAEAVPDGSNLTYMDLSRDDTVVDKDVVDTSWVLSLGVLAQENTPFAVDFMAALRANEVLQQHITDIRVRSQKRIQYQEQDYQYFVIACHF
ncbi:hypothetical protein ACFL6U_12300 [Planctomycetota bacterium]